MITPMDIENKEFKKGFRGYNEEEVDEFLDIVKEDFENLYTINCLKHSGMPLKKIKEFMDLYLSGNDTIHERLVMFEQQRENILNKIKELEDMLEVVNYKCWYFKEAEKKGDVYYYKNMPEDELPEQINNFLERVKEFHSKKIETP